MSRTDFYLLDSRTSNELFDFACRLVEKIYGLKQSIYIFTESRGQAAAFNELLWSYCPHGFIPHVYSDDAACDETPVLIGYAGKPHSKRDVLFNLALQPPVFYKEYSRIVEILNEVETIRNAGREHYRLYRNQGYELHPHKIRNKS